MNLSILELMVSAGLVVLIWLIQILHYPSFWFIKNEEFPVFSSFHGNRISLIVIPLMFLEVGFAIYNPRALIIFLILAIWLSTFLLQVPCHNKLSIGHDPQVVERLISTNWIRTILWTLKLIILMLNY